MCHQAGNVRARVRGPRAGCSLLLQGASDRLLDHLLLRHLVVGRAGIPICASVRVASPIGPRRWRASPKTTPEEVCKHGVRGSPRAGHLLHHLLHHGVAHHFGDLPWVLHHALHGRAVEHGAKPVRVLHHALQLGVAEHLAHHVRVLQHRVHLLLDHRVVQEGRHVRHIGHTARHAPKHREATHSWSAGAGSARWRRLRARA
mmetsp:Transcript_4853/g.15377  ORF Transcript_4853/g.15377 Transcript_4853/m.15377 type:complete len:202 (-) Transcript_4853:1283-1888(-)